LFGVSAPLLNLHQGDLVVDSGCGYAWTTEWLQRAGFEPIGVDICRTYLDVAIERIGIARYPHLVVADVEHLPLRAGIAKGVLAYESFHHIPDRHRAMTQYERVLQDGGVVVLAEPGAEHEHAPAAVAAMTKYGILEQGMELPDVLEYAEGTSFAVEQVLLLRLAAGEVPVPVDTAVARAHTAIEGNLFRAVKGGAAGGGGSDRRRNVGASSSASKSACRDNRI
jgi:SAM-dependent methyltransferase